MTSWSEAARAGIKSGLGPRRLRMNANESPWDLPPGLKAEVLAALKDVPFSRYDYALRPQLVEALSAYSSVAPECIIPGNGADELIQLCVLSLTGEDSRVVIAGPTFQVFGHAAATVRRPLVNVPLRDPDFSLDEEGLVGAARPGDLVFLCRPNNPTGNAFPRSQVLRVLDRLQEKRARVVVDEAYYEFCGDSVAGEVAGGARPGLVVLRTLSKAFRLAGLRLGYALVSPPLAASMEAARLPYNLSAASMAAALAVLARPALARRTAAALNALRDELSAELATIPGIYVYPSETNFLLLKVPCQGADLQEEMAGMGVLIRHYPREPRLAGHVRVTAGDRRQNKLLVETMRSALQAGRLPPSGQERA